MSTLSKGYTFSTTEQVTAAKLHTLVDSGSCTGILTADINDSQVTDAKIYSVAGSKFISLSGIPAGAGYIPSTNLATIPNASLYPITLASWVDGNTFHNLGNVPSGAGLFPMANLATLNASIIGAGVLATARLGSGTASSSNFLRGDSAWATASGFSNVIFCWADSTIASEGGVVPTDETFRTFQRFRFTKMAGISTITIQARMKNETNQSSRDIQLKVDIGGSNNTIAYSYSGDTDYHWVTAATIDVSSLTNGTTYDGVCQIRQYQTTTVGGISAITLIAS